MVQLERQLPMLLAGTPTVFHDPFLQSSSSQGGLAGQVTLKCTKHRQLAI